MHLGVEAALPENTTLMILLDKADADSLPDLVSKVDAKTVFSALVEPLLIAPDTIKAAAVEVPISNEDKAKKLAVAQSYLIQAADKLAGDKSFLDELKSKQNDPEFLEFFRAELINTANGIAKEPPAAAEINTLGFGDMMADLTAVADKLKGDATRVIKKIKESTVDKATRAASLAALQWQRTDKSRSALLFFGDVFEYLRRGWSKDVQESITDRLAGHIKDAYAESKKRKEPFVLVTHSFGSMILFDILTSYKFDEEIKVDLWAMAGAQVSLFAEMRLFGNSSPIPGAVKPFLPKPKPVNRWVNFYDQADIFSYLAQPVFGEQVEDIEFKKNANIKTAHGDYFAQPAFYERLLKEIQSSVPVPR